MIYIRKNGIYYENNYNRDSEEYVMTKVESVIPYLNDEVHIDSEINLEDFLTIVEKDEEIMNIVFGSHLGHFSLRPFLEEIKKDCMPESQEDMEYLELSWVAEQFNYREFYEKHKDDPVDEDSIFGKFQEPDEDTVNEITIYVDVHGWGKFEPQEKEIYKEEKQHAYFAHL